MPDKPPRSSFQKYQLIITKGQFAGKSETHGCEHRVKEMLDMRTPIENFYNSLCVAPPIRIGELVDNWNFHLRLLAT